uniref:Uncharacterized protein n=1 Tax=Strongyloides stercoralis TaxID=6248 RepID=A0A0K0DS42_STRER
MILFIKECNFSLGKLILSNKSLVKTKTFTFNLSLPFNESIFLSMIPENEGLTSIISIVVSFKMMTGCSSIISREILSTNNSSAT